MLSQPSHQSVAALAAISLLIFAQPGRSQGGTAGSAPIPGIRRALILVGLPGDAAHEESFRATTESLHQWLTEGLGFSAGNVTVLFGGSELRPSGAKSATKEDVRKAIEDITASIQPNDTFWLLMLGHANHDGRRAWFHLPGPDVHDVELADWCAGIECREQIFWLTHTCSGSFLKPLSRPGRTVITATTADNEINETEFPHALASIVERDGPVIDQDGNEQITLLELFRAIADEVTARFVADHRIPTEHAQLDDNGDGRGTEAPDLVPTSKSQDETGVSSSSQDGTAAGRTVLSWRSRTEETTQESATTTKPLEVFQ